ncbi:MAG: ABC transporter transmembrane domain-containing protein [Actinobacteria bacterium]|nr:ABC transporter transmembrane domain-containing protein [Actinomycetota bacterium]
MRPFSRRPRRGFTTEERSDLPLREQLGQLTRLFGFLRPYRRWLAAAIFGVTVASALGLVFPLIMGGLVDTAIGEEATTESLDRIALLLFGVFFAQAVFNYLRAYALGVVGEGVVADLRRAVYERIVRLPVPFFDQRRTGEITSRLTSDASVIQTTVSTSVAQALSQGITLIGGVALMLVLSPQLSLTVLAFLPIAIIAAAFFGRRLNRISTVFQDEIASPNAFAEESISSIRVVKWFTAEADAIHRYDKAIRRSYLVALRRARLRALFVPSVTFVAFGTLAVVLWVGGRQVLAGSMTAGELVSFLLYTLTVAGAIGTFTGLYSQLQEALGASRRIFELLGEPVEVHEPEEPRTPSQRDGSVRFESVNFNYVGRDIGVLHEIDLSIAPGEVVALVGPSGSGKSTITQLIARFYDPSDGRVLVDGVDVREQALDDLRAQMAAVPQEVQLFSGTISENLRLAKPHASDEELVEAATAANAHDFIVGFPDGYESLVGERGIKLSGGQRQRVAIARALLADPRILILDEATSSLDAEAEGLVQEALERLMVGRTTLVIAHRLSTVRAADRLVVISDGRIVEEGTHDELVAASGVYARLLSRQLVG